MSALPAPLANPGACQACGWQVLAALDGVVWCRCSIERARATSPDAKLRAFVREWDMLGEEGKRCDQEHQAQGEEPLGALLIFAPRAS